MSSNPIETARIRELESMTKEQLIELITDHELTIETLSLLLHEASGGMNND